MRMIANTQQIINADIIELRQLDFEIVTGFNFIPFVTAVCSVIDKSFNISEQKRFSLKSVVSACIIRLYWYPRESDIKVRIRCFVSS